MELGPPPCAVARGPQNPPSSGLGPYPDHPEGQGPEEPSGHPHRTVKARDGRAMLGAFGQPRRRFPPRDHSILHQDPLSDMLASRPSVRPTLKLDQPQVATLA